MERASGPQYRQGLKSCLVRIVICPESTAGCRRVIAALAEREGWPPYTWAYDGQKALFTAQLYLDEGETVYEVGGFFLYCCSPGHT